MKLQNNTIFLNNSNIERPTTKQTKEKGSIRALLAGGAISTASAPLGFLSLYGIQNVAKKLSPEQIQAMNDAADRIIKDTGLLDKGVKIDNVRWAGLNLTGIPDCIMDIINQYSAIANGKNAAFTDKAIKNKMNGEILHSANTVLVNRQKLPNAIFHELGHAFNRNSSKVFKVLQKMRGPLMLLPYAFIAFSAFTKKATPENGEELTKGQKAKNFVRNNSGLLAAASMLPIVAEELMATFRGNKWAAANLTKDLAKKVKITNVYGAISHIAATLAVGIAAHATTKIKDHIMEKENSKKESV